MPAKTPFDLAYDRVCEASATALAASRAHTVAERNFSRLRWDDASPVDVYNAAHRAVTEADAAWAKAVAAQQAATQALLALVAPETLHDR